MRARTVVAPDDRVWRVSYRWLPRRPRWVGPNREELEWLWFGVRLGEAGDLPLIGWVFLAIAVCALLVLVLALLLPALALVADVLVVLVLASIGVMMRALFGHPWIIEAEELDRYQERREWTVVGWRASGRAIREVGDKLSTGWPLDKVEPTDAVRPAS